MADWSTHQTHHSEVLREPSSPDYFPGEGVLHYVGYIAMYGPIG